MPTASPRRSNGRSPNIRIEEHRIYPEALRLFFEGRIEVRGRRVFIDD
jgi:phosphoribosylglycinamide formyltransferase-1